MGPFNEFKMALAVPVRENRGILRCLLTSTDFSAILILGSCLVVSRLQSNDAGVPGLLFRDL